MTNDANREILIQVATLYYQGKMSQDEIAEIMSISRTKVSRMLKECRDLHIVEFRINTSAASIARLEEKLKKELGLREVLVVPASSNSDDSKKNVGKRAAEYLQENIKRGMDIGVSWGSTVMSVINEYTSKQIHEDIRVVQLSGGINADTANYDAKDIVRRFSEKLHAESYYFQAPLVLRSKLLRDLLQKEPEIKASFDLFARLDLAVIGIGSGKPDQSVAYSAGYISEEDNRILVENNAVGDVCGHRITKDGEPAVASFEDRVLAIDLNSLKRVATVVAVATGSEKAKSICSVAKGGFIDVLIIDDLAAISIEHALNNEKSEDIE